MENKIEQNKEENELVTIDYYDRINKKWIKLDVNKEVARFLSSSNKQMKRKQNQYNFRNCSLDTIFNEEHPEMEGYLADEDSCPESILRKAEEDRLKVVNDEHMKTVIQNALCCLTPIQREVVEMAFYQNMSYSEIALDRGVKNKSSIYKIMKAAEKNIRKFIEQSGE